MFGLNWIDCIIVLLLVGVVVGGMRVGLLKQAGLITGFFAALFVGGWLWPHLLPIHDQTLRTLINANLVLIGATYAGFRSFDFGSYVHQKLRKTRLRQLKPIEAWLGIIPSAAALLILVWLLAALIGRLPFVGFSNSANDALIVQKLDTYLPPVPAVLAEFSRVVDPNTPTTAFAIPKPQPSFDFSASDVQDAIAKAQASIVRITSFSCGGIVNGSGFVVGHNLIATNAHVIAGDQRPIVKYKNYSFETVPVLFNPNLDFALLRVHTQVHSFDAPPLQLIYDNISTNTSVAVLGYPGGSYAAVPGIIRIDLTLFGHNIYDVGNFGRNVYEVQTTVATGSSGGPIVQADGRVVGVLFAKNNDFPNDAYALTSSHIVPELRKAEKSQRRISTGVCMAD